MNSASTCRLRMILGGALAAIAAVIFAAWLFNVLTPPRDINFIINNAGALTPPAAAFPSPTRVPVTPRPITSIQVTYAPHRDQNREH